MTLRGRSEGAATRWTTGRLAVLCLAVGALVGGVTAAVVPASSTTSPTPAPNSYLGHPYLRGQVVSDPFVLTTPKLDYMYQTGNSPSRPNVPVRSFTTMAKISQIRDAMPVEPSWVAPDTRIWAPDVRKVGNRYVMWFTAEWGAHTIPTGAYPKCISWATSTSPFGPFVDTKKAPAICQLNQFGDIDPRTLVAPDGQEWLYWKSDDNADYGADQPTIIWAQKLAKNGTTPEGLAADIYANHRLWEGRIVEAPNMVYNDGSYYLFFSGNSTHLPQNGIGLAVCKHPNGPCTSTGSGPFLGANTTGMGPGEESLFQQNGDTWMLYSPHSLYYPLAYPTLQVSRIAFGPSGPYVAAFDGVQPGV